MISTNFFFNNCNLFMLIPQIILIGIQQHIYEVIIEVSCRMLGWRWGNSIINSVSSQGQRKTLNIK